MYCIPDRHILSINKSGKVPEISFSNTPISMSRNCRVAFPLSMRVRLKISVNIFASLRPSFPMMFRYFSALLSSGQGKRAGEGNSCKKNACAAGKKCNDTGQQQSRNILLIVHRLLRVRYNKNTGEKA